MKKLFFLSIAFLLLVSGAFPAPAHATISSQATRIQYTGNDVATSFPFPYKFLQTSDLTVVFTNTSGSDSTLVEDTDYTVTGAGVESGGTVTYPVSGDPLATGEYITIYRQVPYTQEADLSNQGAYFLETIEDTADKLSMQIQQVKEITDRCPKLSISDFTSLPNIDDIVAAIQTGVVTIDEYNNDLVAAKAAIGASKTTLVVNDTTNLTADLTLPATLTLWPIQGGTINISSGKTLTHDGDLISGLYQFISGAGKFKPTNVKEVSPRWWGANGGSTDDSAAWQKAIDAVGGTDIPVRVFNGMRVENGVTVNGGTKIIGNGRETVILPYDGPWSTTAVIYGTAVDSAYFTDFSIDGTNLTPATHPTVKGIHILESPNITFDNLKITGTPAHSIRMDEDTSGSCQYLTMRDLYLGEQQVGGTGKPILLESGVGNLPGFKYFLMERVTVRGPSNSNEGVGQLYVSNGAIRDCDFEVSSKPILITIPFAENLVIEGTRFVNGHTAGSIGLELAHVLTGVKIDNCYFEQYNNSSGSKAIANTTAEAPASGVHITNSRFKTDSRAIETSGPINGDEWIIENNRLELIAGATTTPQSVIDLTGGSRTIVANNYIDMSAAGAYSHNGIHTQSDYQKITGNEIIGNSSTKGININNGQFCDIFGNTLKTHAIGLNLAASFTLSHNIGGNRFDGCTTAIGGSATALASRTNKIWDNYGYTTEASGTYTLPNGQTTGLVTHGLDRLPVAGDIWIMPAETWGSATEYWSNTFDITSFQVNVDQDPGADVDFIWKAKIY